MQSSRIRLIEANKHRAQRDPEFCFRWLLNVSGKKCDVIYQYLAEYCSPSVATKLESAIRFQIEMSHVPRAGFINLRHYLLSQSLVGQSYQVVIERLLSRYREDKKKIRQSVVMILVEKLKSDPPFRRKFSNEAHYLQFFGPTLLGELIACNNSRGANQLVYKALVKASHVTPYPVFRELVAASYQFKSTNKVMCDNVVSAAVMLSDHQAVCKQLAKLEAALQIRAGDRLDHQTMTLRGYQEGVLFRHQKLLSGYLYSWAKIVGYSGYAVIYSSLYEESSQSMLRSVGLFKDVAFRGTYHGEWTHFLQQFCLDGHQKDTGFLSTSVPDLIRWIGEQEVDIWDKTFEMPPRVSYCPDQDARHVVTFNDFLLSDECRQQFPVLSQLIRSRSIKPNYDDSDNELEEKESIVLRRF